MSGRNVVIGILALACGSGVFADTIAADNLGGRVVSSGYFIGVGYTAEGWANEAAAQEFVAGVSGRVSTLLATVDRWQAGDVPLKIAIHGKAAGTVGARLGQVAIPSSAVPQGLAAHSFDLSSAAIDLTAGHSYYAVFTADTPVYQSLRYRALRAANPSMLFGLPPMYSTDMGGSWNYSPSSAEIGLTVNVVPEPGTLLLVLGVWGTLTRRRAYGSIRG